METEQINFWLNNEQVIFNVFHFIKQPKDICVISMIDTVNMDDAVAFIEERLGVEDFAIVILKFETDDIEDYDDMVS